MTDNRKLWQDFANTITWGDLCQQFLEALTHIERFKAAQPGARLPEPVAVALQRMVQLHARLRSEIQNPAIYAQRATPEAVSMILSVVAKVRRTVPVGEPMGHA